MRKELLILAVAAIALAGCKTGTEDYIQCGIGCPPPQPDDDDDDNAAVVDPDPNPDITGNETNLRTGNTTIALENGKLKSSNALSQLAITDDPSTAMIRIDTNTDTNRNWFDPVAMNEYLPGSNAVDFFNPARGYNVAQKLGSTSYKEYRYIASDLTSARDEILQVWTWNHSRAVQYRTGGSNSGARQAFSFEGDATDVATLPTAGTGTYQGRYGSTAKSENWVERLSAQVFDANDNLVAHNIQRNGTYLTNGSANVDVNFGSGAVAGTLAPEQWQYFDTTLARTVYYSSTTGMAHYIDDSGDEVVLRANIAPFMATNILLNGQLTGNTYSGTAKLGGAYINGTNAMKGGLFGDGAAETTGAFTANGTAVGPDGGEFPIGDDRRAYVNHSGVFNGQCQAGTACTP